MGIALILACAPAVARAWRGDDSPLVRVSLLVFVTLLVTPHLLTYDLLLLTIPIMALAEWVTTHPDTRQARGAIMVAIALYHLVVLAPARRARARAAVDARYRGRRVDDMEGARRDGRGGRSSRRGATVRRMSVPNARASGTISRLLKWATVLFPVVLLPIMLAVSPGYGATWDEELQQQRGEKIVAYYTGRVGDLTFPEDGAHLYGAPFDVLAVAIQHVVPGDTYKSCGMR